MRIAIYGRCSGNDSFASMVELLAKLKDDGVALSIYTPLHRCLSAWTNVGGCSDFSTPDELDASIDCLLSIGGDGTFLEAAQFAVRKQTPILGINFGRLGFLAQVPADGINAAMDDLLAGRFRIEDRPLIEVSSANGHIHSHAINEIAIQRNNPTMINTIVHIGSDHLSSYWSDGLLVSTPTGSTAYSLSVGGPIVLSNTGTYIVTPIASHNLSIRPIVISDDSCISIEVLTRKGSAMLSADNQMYELESGSVLHIKKSALQLRFVKLEGYSFFRTLHTKLNWGMDIRN